MAVETFSNIQPGFMVLHSNRIENLRSLLVDWLRQHPLEPLENEILLVQSNGIAQWLKLSLAENPDAQQPGCGIAAAMEITLPGRYHWQAYRSVLGDLPTHSPYDKAQLTWRIFRLLPELLEQPVFAALKYFLADSTDGRKRFQLAGRLADLLDQYQVYRADWLGKWASGDDQYTYRERWQEIPDSERWQPALWRRIVADIQSDGATPLDGHNAIDAMSSRAQVHQYFLDVCREMAEQGDKPRGLPRRIVVFGLSTLPRQSLEMLSALSAFSQVLLFVHNPCQFYWGDIIDPVQAQRWFTKPFRRQPHKAQNQTADLLSQDSQYLQSNPLLASWGKQGRDYIRLLDEHDERKHYESMFHQNELSIDVFEAPEENTLLGRIQSDIYHLRTLPEAKSQAETGGNHEVDVSGLSFHQAHGKQREVEVLQDQLLSWFDADPGLKPRDILVMVPDINLFAPHIQAVFGSIAYDDDRYIPYSISDQGQRSTSLLLQAFEMLLDIPHSRLPVTEVLDLLDVPALRNAFDLAEEDMAILNQWIEGAGIRWGFHAEHRISEGFSADFSDKTLTLNTWLFGLRRMLLGYASGATQSWQDIEPYPEVGGLSAAAVGKLAHLLSELEQLWQRFQHATDVPDWIARIYALLQTFFVADDDADQYILNRIGQRLEQWQETCALADFRDNVDISIVHDYLQDLFEQQELSQRFLSGSVNFASLMPMRAIPFRRICLLGMNDADYPRQVTYSDFDLMRDDYRPGDRSRREDDRYLFLEALLSAREHLSVSWSAFSISDNAYCPPSVLVAQLRDYIADTRGSAVLDKLTHRYPLQPFSQRYFNADSPLVTYAREWEPPSLSREGDPKEEQSINDKHDTADVMTVGLQELSQLMRNPAQEFFRQSLHVSFSSPDEEQSVDEPFALSNLDKWQVNQSILEQSIYHYAQGKAAATDMLGDMIQQIQDSGRLPLPPFDADIKREISQTISSTLEQINTLLANHPQRESRQISVFSESANIHLEDSIADIWRAPDGGAAIRLVNAGSSLWAGKKGKQGKPKWRYIARHWPFHLACQLNGPVTTWLVSAESSSALLPLSAEDAIHALRTLIDLYACNLASPLVAEPDTSCALIDTPENDDDTPAISASDARLAYEGSGNTHRGFPVVQQSYALKRLWPDFDSLLSAGAESETETVVHDANRAVYPSADISQSLLFEHSQALYRVMCKHWHDSRTELKKREEV